MNTLDKIFSREIKRRTGAHAINIYIENATKTRKRSRSLGASALRAATKTKITTRQSSGSFFHRLNIRFPWLKFIVACSVCAIIILDLCNLTISKVEDPSNKIRIAPMHTHIKATDRVFKDKKLVALTFDDGPSTETTPKLLDILREKDVLATFFVLGSQARNHPDIIKRVEREHHEVASHTMYHQNLVRISNAAAASDINEAKTTLKDILGHYPTYTRPPYGNINDTVRTTTGTPLILWSVDSEDWRSKDPNSIIQVSISEVHDGAIILMHDIYPTTVDAVPALIDTLRQNGYEFTTISELAKIRKATLAVGTAYYNLLP